MPPDWHFRWAWIRTLFFHRQTICCDGWSCGHRNSRLDYEVLPTKEFPINHLPACHSENMESEPDGRPAPFIVNEVWSMDIFDQFTSLQGRINRLRYLGISVILYILLSFYLVFVLLLFNLIGTPLIENMAPEMSWLLYEMMIGLALIPFWYSAYAITVKRLQDMNWGTGWTTYTQIYVAICAMWGLVPSGFAITFEILLGILVTIGGIPLIVTVFAPGERGPNQFGPDPLGRVMQS